MNETTCENDYCSDADTMEVQLIDACDIKEDADLAEVTDDYSLEGIMEVQLFEVDTVKQDLDAPNEEHGSCAYIVEENRVKTSPTRPIKCDDDDQYICGICHYKGKNMRSVILHMRAHKEKQHVCAICSLVASSKDDLGLHMASHRKEVPFSCIYCGHGFFRECALQYHACRKRPKLCQFCSEPFHSRKRLKAHMREKHNEQTPKKRHCPHCEFSCWSGITLNDHLKTHSGNKMLHCPHCTFQFSRLAQLQVHMKIHRDEPSFTCPYCSAVFAKYGIVKLHMELHKDREVFSCSQCNFQSPSKTNLRVHIWRMHRFKNHVCPNCDYKTSIAHRFKRHLLSHKGDSAKLHVCSACDYKTKYPWDLTRHVNSFHKKETIYPCPHCDFKAMTLLTLKKHTPRHTQKLPLPDFL